MLTQTLPRITRQTGQMAAHVIAGRNTEQAPQRHGRFQKYIGAGAVLLLVLAGAYFRFQGHSSAADTGSSSNPLIRQVSVTLPERTKSKDLVLPATVQAYQAADLFARVNGYLKAWYVDIGAPIKAGQLLAEIETPEVDQELAQAVAALKQGEAEFDQARAELEEAKAELVLAEANVLKVKALLDYSVSQANRYSKLVQSRGVSQEEYEGAVRDREARIAELASTNADVSRRKTNLETRKAIIESKQAIVNNRQANVQRLRYLTGFQKVQAPFDGVVTRRNAETGMLVTAGSNVGNLPLFSVAQVDILRVHAAVPQSSALGIRAGDPAWITVPEKPGQSWAAKVSRSAGAVDPASRSLLVEVELPNPNSELLPGLYVQVRFQSSSTETSFIIPIQALQIKSTGPHVIEAGSDGTLHARKVTLGRDFGKTVEVVSGLRGDERLVLNPSDDLRDGQVVNVLQVKQNQIAQK